MSGFGGLLEARPSGCEFKSANPRWGCPGNFSRGTCPNSLRERNEYVEAQLLEGLQQSVLQPEVLEYALLKFEMDLEKELSAARQ